jgi:hypothetical protein
MWINHFLCVILYHIVDSDTHFFKCVTNVNDVGGRCLFTGFIQKMHNNIHTYMYIKVFYFYLGYLYIKEYHINNKEKSRKRKIDLYLYLWLKYIS